MWLATPEFRRLRASTQADYRNKAELFLSSPLAPGDTETWADVPVAALGRAALKSYWREAYDQRGHAMANAVMAVVRTMLTHATDLEWIPLNPAFALKLPTLPPRQMLWLPADVAALVATADRMQLPEVADAVIVALHSGQRQADVLALPARLFSETRIRLSQFKRAARIDAPMTPQLIERLAAIRARQGAVVRLDAPLIADRDGAPYSSDRFRKAFAAVRAEAVCARPELARLTFQDLRDTAVTRLALAQCSLAEIAAITGHSLASITTIVKHYLVLQPEMADAAIGKLAAWIEKEGIAL
jgi:integrase